MFGFPFSFTVTLPPGDLYRRGISIALLIQSLDLSAQLILPDRYIVNLPIAGVPDHLFSKTVKRGVVCFSCSTLR